MEPLRQTRVHRALHRPQMILGGERELMLFSALLAGGIAMASLNLVATISGGVIWIFCAYGLRRMAKADPILSKIYMRHRKYADHYPAFSRPWRKGRRPNIW
ncbi:MAG: VirB3 family type IV secretion system protein [Paracoccaceae bacterium]|nr:VirB3 family type IV secretion system protein [Paracoccaceae bacterium]